MKNEPLRRWLACGLVMSAGIATKAMAAPGCTQVNLATYQIGQTTYVDVRSSDPEGKLLRQGEAAGEGKLLLRCNQGTVTFRGRWQNAQLAELLPLTVGGQPAGVALKLFLREGDGEARSFPHDFNRAMAKGEEVRSDMDSVGYELYRTSGPVRFGKIDSKAVAQSSVDKAGGGLVVFRSMQVYDLILRREACAIVADDLNQRIELPPYNLSNFATADRATPWEAFRLRVDHCVDPVGLIARVTFGTRADADTLHADWFSLRGPKNVALELGTKDFKTIAPGVPVEMNALGTGDAYEFHVRLRETRPTVVGGEFSRLVRVQVDYL